MSHLLFVVKINLYVKSNLSDEDSDFCRTSSCIDIISTLSDHCRLSS